METVESLKKDYQDILAKYPDEKPAMSEIHFVYVILKQQLERIDSAVKGFDEYSKKMFREAYIDRCNKLSIAENEFLKINANL